MDKGRVTLPNEYWNNTAIANWNYNFFFSILAGEAPMKAREFICCDEGVMFETSVTVTNLHYQVCDRSKPSCNAPTEGRHSLFRN